MNEQEKFWELIKQVRFELYYIDEYIRETNRTESWVNGTMAVASNASSRPVFDEKLHWRQRMTKQENPVRLQKSRQLPQNSSRIPMPNVQPARQEPQANQSPPRQHPQAQTPAPAPKK